MASQDETLLSSGAGRVEQSAAQRRRTERALHSLADEIGAPDGGDFYDALVRQIAKAFDVHCAFATVCADAANSAVRMLACWHGAEFGAKLQYPLENTPCQNVIAGNACLYPEAVQSLFPRDSMLAAMNAQAYLGAPLYGAQGNIVGHLALVDNKPFHASAEDVAIVKIFAARAAAALERQRMGDTLAHIAAGTAGVSGEDFFNSLARHLAEALQVRYCFAAECTDDSKLNVRMLAFWTGAELGPRMEYNVIYHQVSWAYSTSFS